MNYCKRTSLKLKGKRELAGGSFGEYFKLSKHRGIKILYGVYPTAEQAAKSTSHRKALRENKILQILTQRGCRFTPKGYGVRIVKVNSSYSIGIVMQHLGNKCLFNRHGGNNDEIISDLRDKLNKVYRVFNGDVHSQNIMYYKKKYWVIDFTPTIVQVKQPLKSRLR